MVGGQLESPNMQLLSIRGTGLSVYIQNDKGLSVFTEDGTSPKEHPVKESSYFLYLFQAPT